jgi:hypothetical protein
MQFQNPTHPPIFVSLLLNLPLRSSSISTINVWRQSNHH